LNLLVLAKAYQALGQFQNAIDHFGRVMVLAAAAGDGSPMRLSYVGLGDIYRSQGRYPEATDCYLQALEASDEKDVTAEGAALLGLGLIYHQMGDDDAALERVHQALNLAEDDPVLQNKCNVMLAYIARNQGRYGEALMLCEQALNLAENAQDLNGMGNSHSILGLIHSELGHPTRAAQHLAQSIEIATTSGDIASKCQRLSRLCGVEIDRGDITSASDYGIDALATAVRIGGWAGERLARMQLGRLALLTNDPQEAVTQLMAAAKVARAIQSNLDLYAIQVYLAQAYLRLGQPQKALDSIEPIYITAVQRPFGAMTQGLILTKLGDAWGAEQSFQEAVATADKLLKQPPLPFRAGYIKVVALAGLAVVAEEGQPANLQKSQAALEKAIQTYRGAGALKEAAHWLDELQKIIGEDDLFTPLWNLLKIEE
jgi:tetratricopeptide (TPR) repeat protein